MTKEERAEVERAAYQALVNGDVAAAERIYLDSVIEEVNRRSRAPEDEDETTGEEPAADTDKNDAVSRLVDEYNRRKNRK